jgi:hypothetical protein
MRTRVAIFFLLVATPLTLSLIRGQERLPSPEPPTALPAGKAGPAAPVASVSPVLPRGPARDFSRLSTLQQQFLLAGQRGADWLFRMNGVKGRFLHGYLPALKQELEGDSFLHQAGAACALARAARLTGEERYAARAAQAILALLDETALDPGDSRVRCTTLPPAAVNRTGAVALLVLAIHELPAPQADLLDRSDQLCAYLRKQARKDGSLAAGAGEAETEEEVEAYSGLALHALLVSQKHRPADWKLDLARKALPHYRAWWRQHRSMAFVAAQTAAWTEAYARGHDKAFAEFVHEMNDWLCGLQYARIEPRRLQWYGGFMTYQGRALETAPGVEAAVYAESLVHACRTAREAGDVARHDRYKEAAERTLQFLATLQYTDASTQHFAAWYRPRIVGAFHANHQDGNLRIDQTEHAVSALVEYLEMVTR